MNAVNVIPPPGAENPLCFTAAAPSAHSTIVRNRRIFRGPYADNCG